MKYVPLEKQSKKAKKAYYSSRRNGWGETNPVTKVTENKKAYNRKKIKEEVDY